MNVITFKSHVINPDGYYVLQYHWQYYAEGITGRNENYCIWCNDKEGNGFPDKKSANEVVKIIKSNDRIAMKDFKQSGNYSKGSQGGVMKIVKGNRFLKAIEKFKNDYRGNYHSFNRVTGLPHKLSYNQYL